MRRALAGLGLLVALACTRERTELHTVHAFDTDPRSYKQMIIDLEPENGGTRVHAYLHLGGSLFPNDEEENFYDCPVEDVIIGQPRRAVFLGETLDYEISDGSLCTVEDEYVVPLLCEEGQPMRQVDNIKFYKYHGPTGCHE